MHPCASQSHKIDSYQLPSSSNYVSSHLLSFRLPLYYEAKVVFVILLWHPKVKLAAYLFDQHLRPMLRTHEANIDRSLGSAKTRALDYVSGQYQR